MRTILKFILIFILQSSIKTAPQQNTLAPNRILFGLTSFNTYYKFNSTTQKRYFDMDQFKQAFQQLEPPLDESTYSDLVARHQQFITANAQYLRFQVQKSALRYKSGVNYCPPKPAPNTCRSFMDVPCIFNNKFSLQILQFFLIVQSVILTVVLIVVRIKNTFLKGNKIKKIEQEPNKVENQRECQGQDDEDVKAIQLG